MINFLEGTSKAKKRKFDELLEMGGEKTQQSNDEFQQWLHQVGIETDEDPLTWWREHEKQFPTIAKIAKKYLCIPATSVPSERLFSDAGNVITKKRASMDPETLEEILMVYENCELTEKLIE